MKETTKKQKRLYIILLIATVAVVIAAIALSLVFGLSANNVAPPDDGGGTVNAPVDPDDQTPSDPVNPDQPDEPDNPDQPDEPDNPDDPVNTDPIFVYQMPIAGATVGQGCSLDTLVWSTTLQWYSTHNGTDFIAESGNAVMSVCGGTVTSTGYSGLDGYFVVIEQEDGIISTYKSLGAEITVNVNDVVQTGTIIGTVSDSMTSEQNDGAHLHLEMTENGEYIDPMSKLVPEDK